MSESAIAAPDFSGAARALLPGLVELRRELHAEPEVGFELPLTQQRMLDELAPLDLELSTGESIGSVTAVLRGARPGPVVLLRADMDALPVREETGLSFASRNDAMHACGHDLHMAGLIGAARLLAQHRDRMAGTVLFMLEPGEEAGGGARIMIREGLLEAAGDRPEAAYGIHVLADSPVGEFSLKDGPIMAGANSLVVRVRGKGGHGSRPHEAIDPVPVVAQMVIALQSFARRFSVFDPVVISVTRLVGSEARNVIPDSAGFEATVRALSRESVERLERELPALLEPLARAHGCDADVHFEVNYPVTVNDRAAAEHAFDVLSSEFGTERVVRLEHPVMASEDFSFVLDEVPGTFLFLGARPLDLEPADAEFNHSPRALFDDGVLGDQAAALAVLAWSHVGQSAR